MAENEFGIDPELVGEFVDESEEMLGEAANLFIALESAPGDKEAINRIFRIVHTIKGNAAFFNLLKVKSLAHVMEDLMNLIRDEKTSLTTETSDALIEGIDALKEMMDRVREGEPEISDEAAFQSTNEKIVEFIERAKHKDSQSIWKAIGRDLISLKSGISDSGIKEIIQRMGRNLDILSPVGKVSTPVQVEPEESDPKGYIEKHLSIDFEDSLPKEISDKILKALQVLSKKVSGDGAKLVEEAIDAHRSTVQVAGFTPMLRDIILKKMRELNNLESSAARTAATARQTGEPEEHVSTSGKTMRVAEQSIDQFLDFVGELVVVGEMYHNLQKRLQSGQANEKTISDLKKTNDTFNALSQNLQRSILEVRKVPIKALLQRAPRLVRDIASSHGKKIRVLTEGEDLSIDKSIMETLDGPFTHMLRNSADHGVEMPEERARKGKPEEGLISISVIEEDETMSLSIQDDGAGLDREAILDKAISNGLVSPEKAQSMDEQSVFQLIFAPGFSTAKVVTDVSGRGVGMDVVRRNVDAMNGKITINSEKDKGSTFTITFPKSVTVKIIQGFLVGVVDEIYILPMNVVGESFEVCPDDVTALPGNKGECIKRHERVYPVVRLDRLVGVTRERLESCEGECLVGVSVDTGSRTVILLVDEVLGTQQVVVKDIEGLIAFSDIVTGGAILGDERIAIVLNPEGL